jgi:hypothetical protein
LSRAFNDPLFQFFVQLTYLFFYLLALGDVLDERGDADDLSI